MSDLLIHAFQTHPMYRDISLTDCRTLMNCLGCREKTYQKDQIIAATENSSRFGEVLMGENLSERGILFKAAEPTTILIIPADRILHPCRNSCPFHHKLSRNLFDLLSRRNAALTEKIEITSKSSLREKVLAYLSLEAQKTGSMKVTIPLSRSEMADYLCTNRSALSRELANMKKDGILDYDLRTFHLLQVPESK